MCPASVYATILCSNKCVAHSLKRQSSYVAHSLQRQSSYVDKILTCHEGNIDGLNEYYV